MAPRRGEKTDFELKVKRSRLSPCFSLASFSVNWLSSCRTSGYDGCSAVVVGSDNVREEQEYKECGVSKSSMACLCWRERRSPQSTDSLLADDVALFSLLHPLQRCTADLQGGL